MQIRRLTSLDAEAYLRLRLAGLKNTPKHLVQVIQKKKMIRLKNIDSDFNQMIRLH